MPYVSIVMPIYNGERYLSAALESVLGQSFTDYECLLIDDGSLDGSEQILRDFSRRDSRLKVIHQSHCGVVAALNLGCRLASGKYVARLDGDDVALPSRLEQQVLHMERYPDIALLGGGVDCVDEHGVFLFQMRWPNQSQGLHDYLLMDCVMSHTTVMFRKTIFVSIGGYRGMYQHAEDYDFFLRVADCNTVDNLPIVLGHYRLHMSQVSAIAHRQQILSGLGARLATRERRARRAEPQWRSSPVSREDLIRNGVSSSRIDVLVASYHNSVLRYKEGWRWSNLPFLSLRRNP